mmetsp:Transcript_14022/g.61118  ORF Transcript_14022/g.61118 Transcript_14022/m.61118 type:complete len:150 (-) Transcript_14022:223-672(-)
MSQCNSRGMNFTNLSFSLGNCDAAMANCENSWDRYHHHLISYFDKIVLFKYDDCGFPTAPCTAYCFNAILAHALKLYIVDSPPKAQITWGYVPGTPRDDVQHSASLEYVLRIFQSTFTRRCSGATRKESTRGVRGAATQLPGPLLPGDT